MVALGFLKLSSFFSKYMYYIIAAFVVIAAMFILPNVSAIAEKFGLETRASLKAKTAVQERTIATTIDVNKQVVADLNKEKKSSEIKEDVTVIKLKQDTSITTKIEKIKTDRAVKTAKVIKLKSDNPQKPKVTVFTNNDYSDLDIQTTAEANIDAIWGVYQTVENIGVKHV